jgi:hypothetical protein
MADALQAWLRGDDSDVACAAGCEVARAVGHVVAFVEAHRERG